MLYRFYPSSKWLREYRLASIVGKKYKCEKVLDVGCGKGNLAKVLSGGISLRQYVGVDIEDIAKSKAFNTLFVVADGRNPPVGCCFDCTFFVNSIFYIGIDSLKSYAEISKYIIIIDIDPTYPHVWIVDRIESGFKGMRLSKKRLISKLAELGFHIVETGGSSTYYLVLDCGSNLY